MVFIYGIGRSTKEYSPLTGPNCAYQNKLNLLFDTVELMSAASAATLRIPTPSCDQIIMQTAKVTAVNVVRPTIFFYRDGNVDLPVNIVVNVRQYGIKPSEWSKMYTWVEQIPAGMKSKGITFSACRNLFNGYWTYFDFYPECVSDGEVLRVDSSATFVEFATWA